MDANAVIKKGVDEYESAGHGGEIEYKLGIDRMARIDLANITEADVEEVVKPFLYKWGMGRVLGREKFRDWQRKIADIIQSNSGILKKFRDRNIESEDLSDYKDEITFLYESLKEATSQISSAKILHLICPSFFPIWDNRSANAFRAEVKTELKVLQGDGFDKSIEDFSGQDCFRLMEGMQRFISRHRDIISRLSTQYQRGTLKIIDEGFMWIVGRPFYVIWGIESTEETP